MFDESKHPRDNGGRFTSSDGAGGTHEATEAEKQNLKARGIDHAEGNTKKLTPAEKIASVHIDFDKDNILPELNEEDLAKVGSNMNKPVLLKKNIIDLNEMHHNDLSLEDSKNIIAQALYSDKKEIVPSKHTNKPNYYSFVTVVRTSKKNGQLVYGVTLLDVDNRKDNFEIVHWHYVPYDKLGTIKPKNR